MTDINTVEMKADVNVEFEEASSRQQINSGESVKTLFGKLRKFLTDLKAVAFSGTYNDLIDTPDLTQYATKDSIPPEVNVMTYTVLFDEITWSISSSGKYVYHIDPLNVNQILSMTLSEPWGMIASDEIIQPYVRTTTQIAILSNTAKKTGKMSFRITYI